METQKVEYKSIWDEDKVLSEICGLANADGGVLFVGKDDDGHYLRRAAVLLFHEEPNRFVTGCVVKIGNFKSEDELVYQDEVGGSIITMADKVIDTLYSKYFKGIVSYEGIQRIETYPIAKEALREAVLNAIVHRDYATGVPIQIKVYDDKVVIYNDCALDDEWTIEKLLAPHRSNPHNPDIANTFAQSGMIESWGRGIEKIINSNVNAGKPKPNFYPSKREFSVVFDFDKKYIDNLKNSVVEYDGKNEPVNNILNDTLDDTLNDTLNDTLEKYSDILTLIKENNKITAEEISKKLNKSRATIMRAFDELKKHDIIERIGGKRDGHWKLNI
jgi:ATP-dependent DNA helicase RecG